MLSRDVMSCDVHAPPPPGPRAQLSCHHRSHAPGPAAVVPAQPPAARGQELHPALLWRRWSAQGGVSPGELWDNVVSGLIFTDWCDEFQLHDVVTVLLRYPQIMLITEVSCKSGRGISDLRDNIFDIASQVRESTGVCVCVS